MLPDISLLLVYVSLISILIYSLLKRRHLTMPHPPGWPLVGNALQLTSYGRSDQTLEMWAKQYGPIFSVQVFNMTWVILSGYDQIYEALIQKSRAFSGRYQFFRFSWLVCNHKDIAMSDPNEPHWQPMRKAMHRTIQPRGDHLNRIETVLIDMAQQFVNKIKTYDGEPVDLQEDISNFVSKVAVAMIIGQNVEDNDPLLTDMIRFDLLTRETTSPITGVELDFFPWLRLAAHIRAPVL